MSGLVKKFALNHKAPRLALVWRLVLAVLGLLIGASAVAWGFALLRQPEPVLVPLVVPPQPPTLEAVTKALSRVDEGAAAATDASPAPEAGGLVRLLGVLAAGPNQGSALLAVGSEPARHWRVGQTLPNGLTLLRVSPSGAELGSASTGQVSERLSLPPARRIPVLQP